MDKPEALRLADELPWVKHTANWAACEQAAAELRGLYAVVQAREDDVETHSAAVYEVTRLLSEARTENASLAAALASSCDEQRHQLWESGGIAGCERARVAERQRDALLGALKSTGLFLHHCWCDVQMNDYSFEKLNQQMQIVDAAIAAVEGEKT